jgi:hypothetical protein
MRSESNASFVSYVNNKRRTSTILMKPIVHSKHQQECSNDPQQCLTVKNDHCLMPSENNAVLSSSQRHHPHSHRHHNRHHRQQLEEMRQELAQALENIRYIAAHCAHESLIESIRDEWKFIATVIDRLQFLIFLMVTLFGSLALLYQVNALFVY